MGQFYMEDDPNVMGAADAFKTFMVNVATEAGLNFTPGLTAQESLNAFLQAVAAKEQQQPAPQIAQQITPVSASAYSSAPLQQPTPQTAQFYNPPIQVQNVSEPVPVDRAAQLAKWATVAVSILALFGKG